MVHAATVSQTDYERGVVPEWTTGWRMQRALAHARMSVEQMAEELGVSRSTISRWLNDRGSPSRGYLKLWALRTGVSYDWLMDENESPRRTASIPAGIGAPAPAGRPGKAEILRLRRRLPLRPPPVEPLMRLAAA